MKEASALVLLPGLACDAEVWSDVIDGLGGLADCRVADITGASSIAEMAEAVLAMAPERFAAAGHSLGGYVCFEILRRAPERVTRLALIGTSARPDTESASGRRRRLIERVEAGGFEQIVEDLLPSIVARERREDSALVERLGSMMRRVGPEAFCRQQRAIIERPDSRPDLPRIVVPTLVAAGDEDALMPGDVQQEMADGIPGARRATIEGCGHTTPLERPERVESLLRAWLTDEDR